MEWYAYALMLYCMPSYVHVSSIWALLCIPYVGDVLLERLEVKENALVSDATAFVRFHVSLPPSHLIMFLHIMLLSLLYPGTV